MTGVIVLDKPEGFTSFDAVAKMRRLLHEKKIGHTGTLDPMATGVLPILVGKGTKCADLLPDTNKSYIASFKLGVLSDTEDSTGKILEEDYSQVEEENLRNVLVKFTGEVWQTPPMYSAVQVNGKRLYELAREGKVIEREKRKIEISEITLISFDEETGEGKLSVSCSKGTYIRTLINDIGKELGLCGGIMTALRRTTACGFALEDAYTLEELIKFSEDGTIFEKLRPIEMLFDVYREIKISEAQTKRFKNGGELDLNRLRMKFTEDEEILKVKGFDGEFLGLGKVSLTDSELKIVKLLTDNN